MTELDGDKEQTALALQREIHEKRAQVVADIDELRDTVRIRLSLTHILQSHPKMMQGLTIGLGVAGIGTLALLWRATHRRKQLS
jgi:hypothetical protein